MLKLSLALGYEECFSSLRFIFPAVFLVLFCLFLVWLVGWVIFMFLPQEELSISLLTSGSDVPFRTAVSTLRL